MLEFDELRFMKYCSPVTEDLSLPVEDPWSTAASGGSAAFDEGWADFNAFGHGTSSADDGQLTF
jgi:hypothetical protein